MQLPGENDLFLTTINELTAAGVGLIDACIEYCHKHNIEVEYAANMIAANPQLTARMQVEAENLRYLKKSKRIAI